MAAIHPINYTPPSPLPSTLTPKDTFSITVPSKTDIWRKPPSHNVFTAPFLSHSLPLSSFRSARVTASATWSTLYDQGGLLLVLPPKLTSNTHSTPASATPTNLLNKRWVKAGIEFYEGKPFVSVVAADEWADWSLTPLPESEGGEATVEFEREKGKDGEFSSVLRVTLIGKGGERTIIREVTWAFWGQKDEEEEVLVGPFGAKPSEEEEGKGLEVRFKGFVVEREG